MSQTLLQVRTDVRNRLNESTAKFWTDAMLNSWIDMGALDISRRAENLLSVDTSTAVVAGTQDYNAPAGVLRIHRIEFTPDNGSTIYPLTARSMAEMDQVWGTMQTSTRSYPSYWIERKSPPSLTIRLWPNPSSNGNLYIYYYRTAVPTNSVDGATVDVVEGWYDLIGDYCEWRALRRDNDPDWKEAKALYEENLNNMITTTRKFNDQAGMMETSTGLGVPQWLYAFDGGW